MYTQAVKKQARERLLTHAVAILTDKRNEAPCVRCSYVRDLKRWFISEGDDGNARESNRIDDKYIRTWEGLHRSCVGQKRPEDLRVCYLAGPEPMNDFEVLIGLGVRPQNIWAFESSNPKFVDALRQCCGAGFNQPKLVKMKIEKFLESAPVSFDIVYLDFCASFISSRESLKCVVQLFRCHRLSSPGVLITNFCEADQLKRDEYVEAIARYFFIKHNAKILANRSMGVDCLAKINEIEGEIRKGFDSFYGDFITDFVCNIASVIVPAQRFADSFSRFFLEDGNIDEEASLNQYVEVNSSPDSVLRFLLCGWDDGPRSSISFANSISRELNKELASKPGRAAQKDLLLCAALRDGIIASKPEIKRIAGVFSRSHRFLDQPNDSLYFDFAMRQLSYPMHCNPASSIRLSYVAKEKRMFADAIVFDDCRYVYDWFPAVLQGDDPLRDTSWLYVFRFALDGLVKCRMESNSDYFYQGSVIHRDISGFGSSEFNERIPLLRE